MIDTHPKDFPADCSCENCRWFEAAHGECRVNSPAVVARRCHDGSIAETHWPLVDPGDWCGLWASSQPGAETSELSEASWLVVDVQRGLIDGYYADRAMADAIRLRWEKDLGRPLVLAAVLNNGHVPKIGECFMADNRTEAVARNSQDD